MSRPLPKIIVVVGPTASGKSMLAVKLARKFSTHAGSVFGGNGAEIISADSRQVYRGMDLGTGKITKKEMRSVPHHGLDIANPKKIFTAENYKRYGERVLAKIIQKSHIPIIVGGTGFYIDVLLGRRETANVPPNPKLRKKLEKKSAKALFAMLKKLDPKRAKQIDRNNPRRLVRAIEIAQYTRAATVFSQRVLSPERARFFRVAEKSGGRNPELRTLGEARKARVHGSRSLLWLGIKLPPEDLKKRIHERLLRRMPGIIREIKRLHKNGVSWKRLIDFGLEYRWVSLYVEGKISKEVMLERLEFTSRHYAKRQMTWFRKNKEIHWVSKANEAERLLKTFMLS